MLLVVVEDGGLIFARRVIPLPNVVKRLALRFGAGKEDVVVAAAVERRIEVAGVITATLHLSHDVEIIAEIERVFHAFSASWENVTRP